MLRSLLSSPHMTVGSRSMVCLEWEMDAEVTFLGMRLGLPTRRSPLVIEFTMSAQETEKAGKKEVDCRKEDTATNKEWRKKWTSYRSHKGGNSSRRTCLKCGMEWNSADTTVLDKTLHAGWENS